MREYTSELHEYLGTIGNTAVDRKGKFHSDYIPRKVVRETEKAWMVEQHVNNRRDGMKVNYKWAAKKLCKPLPDELNPFAAIGEKWVCVPEWIVGDGEWN